MTNKVADVLERAADLIETVGHCKRRQWEFISPDYSTPVAYCAVGAITTASDGLIANQGAIHVLKAEIYGPRKPGDWTFRESIPRWNDDDDRTPAEVIDMLRQAAKTARNEYVGPQ
jgi:hypothetical protein